MNSSNIHIVTKVEHHVLSSCPCEECNRERKRRKQKSRHKSYLSIPTYTARLLGLIPSRQSKGSLARALMDENVSYPNW